MSKPNANGNSSPAGDTESATLAQRVRDELLESKSAGQLAQEAAANEFCSFSEAEAPANRAMVTDAAPSQDTNGRSQSVTKDFPCLRAARDYARRGWRVVPVLRGNGKAPNIPDWPKLEIAEADLPRYFGAGQNVGIILGEASGGLIDVDLDVPEAIAAADKLLPATGMIHGRPGKPRSHRWYRVNPPTTSKKWLAPDGTTLCELRANGCQTLVPPSTHPSGETYTWDAEGDATHCDEHDLCQCLGVIAGIAMLARLWPKTPANRHEIAMALAGFLLQTRVRASGKVLSPSAVDTIVTVVAGIAGDGEIKDRARAVRDTAKKVEAGKPITGARKLADLVGRATVDKLREWLDLERENTTASYNAPLSICIADVNPESVQWLWPGRIARGKLTIVDGDPGLGKSLLTLTIAAHVSQGRLFPDSTTCPTGDTVILSAEDGPADTIRPRLEVAGANLDRVHVITSIPDPQGERLPDIERDAARIEAEVIRLKAVLVIVDPLNAYIGGHVNTWSDHNVRRALAPFVALARRTGVAVVVIRHLTKNEDRKALYRGGGSIGFIAAARSGFVVAADLEDPEVRVIACTKQNLAPLGSSLTFKIDTETRSIGSEEVAIPRLVWLGETEQTADELLAPGKIKQDGACQKAVKILRAALSRGPRPATEVEKVAEEYGIAGRTLKRAKSKLGVIVERVGFGPDGHWVWQLPKEGQPQ